MKYIFYFLLLVLVSCSKQAEQPKQTDFFSDGKSTITSVSKTPGTVNGKPAVIVSFLIKYTSSIKGIDLISNNAAVSHLSAVFQGNNIVSDTTTVMKSYSLKLAYNDGSVSVTPTF